MREPGQGHPVTRSGVPGKPPYHGSVPVRRHDVVLRDGRGRARGANYFPDAALRASFARPCRCSNWVPHRGHLPFRYQMSAELFRSSLARRCRSSAWLAYAGMLAPARVRSCLSQRRMNPGRRAAGRQTRPAALSAGASCRRHRTPELHGWHSALGTVLSRPDVCVNARERPHLRKSAGSSRHVRDGGCFGRKRLIAGHGAGTAATT